MQVCTKCKKEKPDDQFFKEPKKKNGLASWCKECKNKASVKKEPKIKDEIRA